MIPIAPETFTARVNELRERMEAQQQFCGMLHPRIETCDPSALTLTMSYPAAQWEANPTGALNGGIIASMLDTTMGTLTYAIAGGFTPTINLNVSYLRPGVCEGTLLVRAEATMAGRAVIAVSAALWDARRPDKRLATAQGVFRNLAPEK